MFRTLTDRIRPPHRRGSLTNVTTIEPAVPGWHTRTDTTLPGVAFNLTALTVVRRDTEFDFVTRTVEEHQAGLDEWCGDFLDASLWHRHQARLRSIDDQAVVRTQQATSAAAQTRQALTEASIHTAAARAQVARLHQQVATWSAVLTGNDDRLGGTALVDGSTQATIRPTPTAAAVDLPFVAQTRETAPELPLGWVWGTGGSPAVKATPPLDQPLPPGSSTADQPEAGPRLRSIHKRPSDSSGHDTLTDETDETDHPANDTVVAPDAG